MGICETSGIQKVKVHERLLCLCMWALQCSLFFVIFQLKAKLNVKLRMKIMAKCAIKKTQPFMDKLNIYAKGLN